LESGKNRRIKMTWKLINEVNMSGGLHTPILYINDAVGGLFIRVLLMVIWSIVTLGLFFTQKKATGQGDFPLSIVVGSLVTTVMTVIFGLIPGLVDTWTYSIVIGIFMLAGFYFLWSKA